MGLRVNKLSKVLGSFTGTSPDPLLTSNAATGQVDTANNLFGSLTSANIWVGSGSNLPVARLISGDISIDNLGVAAIAPGVIVNADINAAAAIAFSKLAVLPVSKAVVTDGSGFITTGVTSATQIGYLSTTTSDVQVQLNAKQATITGAASSVVTTNLSPNIVVVSDGAGKITSSTVSTTALGYITNLTSDAQTQLNSKLTVSLGATVTGDIIYYNGSAWTNLPRGTLGQTLQSTSGSIAWGTPTINGIPSGGTTHQFLAKNSSTNFDASWYTLTTSLITDIVATAAQINSLTTYLTTGGAPTGTNGQVLTISAGTMVWGSVGSGTVTSVDVSGGTTGLTTSGGPITASGTITLSGTLGTINGGTGQTAVATGDILYGSAINTWSRLAAGTNGYVLTMSGGVPIWASGGGGGGMSIGGTVTSGTPGSVLWVGAASALSQDNNNFYWNSGSHVLSVNTNGDFTGFDSINVYNQIDAYKPNSTQGAVGSGTEAGHSVSSSRGTGIAPTVISSGDLLGGFAGWGYTGSVPAYTSLGGMWITSQGVASTLGGQIDFYTRADGGALAKRLTIDNAGAFILSSFVTTGIVHNDATGLFSTSLIVAADVTTNTLTYDKLQQGSPLSVLGNSTNSTANLADIAGTNNQVLRVSGTTLGFGSIDLSQSATVGVSILGIANGGTGGTGGAWLLPSGGTLTGPNTITGSDTNTITFTGAPVTFSKGTLLNGIPAVSITGTQPTSPSGTQQAVLFNITSAGSASQNNIAFTTLYQAGYTGSNSTFAGSLGNLVLGTASTLIPASGSNSVLGNFGLSSVSTGTTIGLKAGLVGNANGGNISVGIVGVAQIPKNSATNIGIVGAAINTGSSPVHVGGWFSLNQTTVPTVSAALIADNGSQTDPIVRFKDNGTDVFAVNDFGIVTLTPTIQSSGWLPALKLVGGADTSRTAATEFIDVDFQLNRSVQWLAGTTLTQRQIYLRGVTLTGASASAIFTTAYTLYIDPPVAGVNASITSSYSLGVSGASVFNIGPSQLIINTGGSSGPRLFSSLSTIEIQSNKTSGPQVQIINQIGPGLTTGYVLRIGIGAGWNAAAGTSTVGMLELQGAFNPSGGSNNFTSFLIDPTISPTGGTATVTGLDYNPTVSIAPTNHYAAVFRSGSVGIGTATPTAKLHVVGATSLDGNLTLLTAGNGLYIKQGTNATCGRGTLVGGTVTINTTKVTSTCEIFITDRGVVTTNLGSIYEDSGSRVVGTSFTVKSTNVLDTSSFCWLIVEAP